ncbi:MAG TPA: alpha/beta hydrolase-fold protein, partial [Candidatus Kryptobacter bacterium]|nr:alpha/beta hydrolase-fold protein [Candidatus Kryptobacter bacterium]
PEAISLENMENVIDYLTAHSLILPVIAVFVPYVNRTPEYAGNQVDSFISFFVNGVVHYVDSTFRTIHAPQGRAVIGASYGGNISLWLGSTYPDIFGNVGAQSSYVDPAISADFQNGNKLGLKIYMDLGTFDIPSLIPMVRGFVQILKYLGYDYEYHEFNEGHSWGNWRAHVKNALELFFPPEQTGVNEVMPKPRDYLLGQNFPNPFNPTTTITYRVSVWGFVTLKVFDILGREVATLVNVHKAAGEYSVKFAGNSLASGVYFYSLSASGYSETRKMEVLK